MELTGRKSSLALYLWESPAHKVRGSKVEPESVCRPSWGVQRGAWVSMHARATCVAAKKACACVLSKLVALLATLCAALNPRGSPAHGSLQARMLEWLPCSAPGDLPDAGTEPHVSSASLCLGLGGFFTLEPLGSSRRGADVGYLDFFSWHTDGATSVKNTSPVTTLFWEKSHDILLGSEGRDSHFSRTHRVLMAFSSK